MSWLQALRVFIALYIIPLESVRRGERGRERAHSPLLPALLRVVGGSLGTQVLPEVLDTVHRDFYKAVEGLYLRYAPSFPGYADVKLVMH